MVSLKALVLLATSAAAAVLDYRTVQPCSRENTPLCVCPEGTTLQQSTTRSQIKAAADDVIAVIGSYHDTAWFGHEPDFVNGTDNEVGGSRTLTGNTPGGPKQFTETLYIYEDNKKGGFTMAYYLENGPVDYYNETTGESGSYAGYWDYLETKALGKKKTRFDWRIYACFTVDEHEGFAAFHEWALGNVNDILMAEGKSQGFSQEPFTIDHFHT